MNFKSNPVSQIGQDIFVFNLFQGKTGYFLDVGCGNGFASPCGNNTLFLEQNGWDGLSLDCDQPAINHFCSNRKSKALCKNLMQGSLNDILVENNCPQVIDYFSFDVDGATETVLKNLKLDYFKFKFITFEHDLYHRPPTLKNLAKEKFKDEYEILIENVMLRGHGAVEDWYVHKELTRDLNKIYLKDMYIEDILRTYGI